MTALPAGITYQGIYCYPSKDDPEVHYFIPAAPSPERDTKGRANLLLVVSDQGASLQLATRWDADANLLEQLRAYLKQTAGSSDVVVRLVPAPLKIASVTLAISGSAGQPQSLATSASAGFYPYGATFNVQLNAEQKANAIAALDGRPNFLTVSYAATLPSSTDLTATISGDVTDDLWALGSDATLDSCLARIDQALTDGRLKLETNYPDDTTPAARTQVEETVRRRAAQALLLMLGQAPSQPDGSTFRVSATQSQAADAAISQVTDVSTWFPNDDARDHILVTAGTITSGGGTQETSSNTVRLGFDIGDAPVAFIQAKAGQSSATLQPPDYAPITLLGGESGPLAVTTNYTDGTTPYTSSLQAPTGDAWVLAPGDAGLVQITVDASAVQRAGATAARVRIHYQPSGEGSDDQRTLFFRRNEWSASYLVVSHSNGLAGKITYDWQETAADGSSIDHDRSTISQPAVTLTPGAAGQNH